MLYHNKEKKTGGDVNNVIAYLMVYNYPYVLGWKTLNLSIIERIHFVYQEAKSNACEYLKVIRKCIGPALDTKVIVQYVVIEIAQF